MKPVNTTRTTFVVWDPEILAEYGIFPQITAGQLVQMEGAPILSAAQLVAIEANPSMLKSPSAADILGDMGDVKKGMVAHIKKIAQGQWGDPNAPTSTRRVPKTRPRLR